MSSPSSSAIVCHECDLLVVVPVLRRGEHAHCPRCEHLLTARRPDAPARLLAHSSAAMIFLGLANAFPFITLNARGMEQEVTLLGSVAVLVTEDHRLLAAVVFAAIVLVPAVILCCVAYVSLAIQLRRPLPGMRMVLRWAILLAPWNMAEIFLVGILISFIKIVDLADVSLGISFWAYTLFTLGVVLTTLNFDRRQLWLALDALGPSAEGRVHG